MSNPTRCIDCEQRIGGIIDWCTLLRQDVTQSCYEHNTPADCPKRDENKKGGTKTSNQKKPRICDVLGVDVGDGFEISGPFNGMVHINEYGHLASSLDGRAIFGTRVLADIINHPDEIIRKPNFTADDLELMRHICAVFGLGGLYRTSDGKLWITDGNYILELPKNILNCIKIGEEMVELKQVLKEADQCH